MKSYASPYDPLTAVRPLPVTSHATPARGDRFHHCVFMPDLPGGNPGSPGYISTAGALLNAAVFKPFRKFSRLKLEIAPFLMFCPKNGSQRMPKLTVTRSRSLHESCAYSPMYVWSSGSKPGAPCSSRNSCPLRKSASGKPVRLPLNVKLPTERPLINWSDVQYENCLLYTSDAADERSSVD